MKTTNLYKELFDCVYQWGRVGIVVDETAPTYRRYIRQIKDQAIEKWCDDMGLCSACGASMDDGHYNNNAECS